MRFDTLKATESKVLGDNKYETTANKNKVRKLVDI